MEHSALGPGEEGVGDPAGHREGGLDRVRRRHVEGHLEQPTASPALTVLLVGVPGPSSQVK